MMNWSKQGNDYMIVESRVEVFHELPTAIYKLNFNSMNGQFWLTKIADKFEFDYDVYELETKFMSHVTKTFRNTSGNMGILLNGVKGTGKSVTAKLLANKFELPVILIDACYPNLDSFLASLELPCVLFFDEFEKHFHKESDISILTIMDGVYNCCERKVFILTTNELHINDNLLSRPSRIRYLKEFRNIDKELVNLIIDKTLIDKSAKRDILRYLNTLKVSTIDILKSIITEVNIHGKEALPYIKDIFNVVEMDIFYDCVVDKYNTSKTYEEFLGKVQRYLLAKEIDKQMKKFGVNSPEHIRRKSEFEWEVVPVNERPIPPVDSDGDRLPTEAMKRFQNDVHLCTERRMEFGDYFANLKKGDWCNWGDVVEKHDDTRIIEVVNTDDNRSQFVYVPYTTNYGYSAYGRVAYDD